MVSHNDGGNEPRPVRFVAETNAKVAIPDPTNAWWCAAGFTGPFAGLLTTVLTEPTTAPYFTSDVSWTCVWGIGTFACLLTGIVRTINRRGG